MVEVKVEISPNALTVVEKRYLKKDKDGRVVDAVGNVLAGGGGGLSA